MVMGRISLVIGRFYVFSDFCAREKVTTTEFRNRARIVAFRCWDNWQFTKVPAGPYHRGARALRACTSFGSAGAHVEPGCRRSWVGRAG